MVKFQWIACGLVMAVALSATGAETTDVVASQNLSINRGKDKPGKKASVHPKDASENIKSPLDRFVMLRFDSEAFDKDVRRAALQLEPVTFDGDQPMRFRVYAVRDGDAEDEQFEEDTYDPSAEGTLFDPGRELMLDTRQLLAIGTFNAEKGKTVQFTSGALVQLIRADRNGTVTLVITRDTEGKENSTFAPRKTKTPPTLILQLADAEEEADAEE
jgi:hypothetical protein